MKRIEDRPRRWSALLDQTEWWKTGDGSYIRVAEMEPRHRANTVRWLMRRAGALVDAMGIQDLPLLYGAPEEAVDAYMREDEERLNDPEGWMSRTPLVQALRKPVDARIDEQAQANTQRFSQLDLMAQYRAGAETTLRAVLEALEQWSDGEPERDWQIASAYHVRRIVADGARRIGRNDIAQEIEKGTWQ